MRSDRKGGVNMSLFNLKFGACTLGIAAVMALSAESARADKKSAGRGTPSVAPVAAPVQNATEQIDQLVREMKPKDAQRVAEDALAKAPSDPELLWRLSRTLVLNGDQEKDKEAQLALYEKARVKAEAAIQADGKNMMAYLRRAAANGKVALFKGVLQARELVTQTRDDAQKAMELNNAGAYPLALANYILGRTHAKLSETPKALRMPLGLQWGNAKDAETYLAKAVELFPGSVAFRTDYGLFLIKAGKGTEGQAQLRAAIALPDSDPGDPAKRAEAQAALK